MGSEGSDKGNQWVPKGHCPIPSTHTHTLHHSVHWVVQGCWKQTCSVWSSAFSLRQVCCDRHPLFQGHCTVTAHTHRHTHTQKYRHRHRQSYRSHYNTVVKVIKSSSWRLWSICWTGHLLSRCVRRGMSLHLQYKEMLHYFSSWPSSGSSIETSTSKNSCSIIFFCIAQLNMIYAKSSVYTIHYFHCVQWPWSS